jgi:hypothetical protein
VGDLPDLSRGTSDPDILDWARAEGRILVSCDRSTMVGHLKDCLARGLPTPGVMIIRQHTTIPDVVEFLAVAAYASDSPDWADAWWFIP